MRKSIKYGLGVIAVLIALLIYIAWTSDIPHETLAEKYATGASDFIDLPSGARAHYRAQGNADGETLVLLHGSNASLHTWEPWVSALSDAFFIITVDLPGHGLTGPIPSDDYTYTGMVKFVKEFTDALTLRTFTLGGNSMGGGVTLAYALEHPHDLKAMVLVDAAGVRLSVSASNKVNRPIAFELAGRWYSDWIIENITPRSLAAEGLNTSVSVKSIINEEMIDRYWELVRHPGNRRATSLRFASYRKAGSNDLPVEKIDIPALIIWGEEDKLIPVDAGKALAARLPDNQLIIYPSVGHLPMEEVPIKSATAVRQFLENKLGDE